MSARVLSSLAGGAARRPRLVLAVALVLGLSGGALALRLHPTAATDTFVSSSSSDYKGTQRFYRDFGEEPVEVLVRGSLQQLVLSSDIVRLAGLEGCLSGNVPVAALSVEGGADGPCGALARARTVKVVFGPGTFVNEAAGQINEQLTVQTARAEAEARQAERVVLRAALARGLPSGEAGALAAQAGKITMARFQEYLARVALQYGLTARPSIEDPNFVSTLVFDSSKPAGTPKARFAYLFPSPDSALISVRMRSGLSERARTQTIDEIRRAVEMPQWRLQHGESYLVTGEPVIVSDLNGAITHSIELLLLVVALVMACTLGLIFAGRPRLLPLGVALLAAAITFGALSLVGASLTMASIAVLPVLVGLAVDYAIQFQSRVEEGFVQDPQATDRPAIVRRTAALAGPTLATAAAASAAAILMLALSPVPMVRGFGVLLAVGVGIALFCALSAGAAVLALPRRAPRAGAHTRVGVALRAAWLGARELLLDNRFNRLLSRVALVGAVRRPWRVLAVGLALAALGWALDGQTKVETDITKLVPQNLSSLQSLSVLERATGVGGEIELMVTGRNVTKASTIEWMSSYENAVLERYGYSSAGGCAKARLCPAFSLPDLFQGQTTPTAGRPKLTQADVSGLLSAIPSYFSQDVITADRSAATLTFGIRLMGLDQQERLIEGMRRALHPPSGVRAQIVGLSVLAAKSGAQVASPWRRLETLIAGLVAVALVLLIAFRGNRRRALAPLAPIVLATGWSGLILFAVRVPLNPMSVTLGVLVIAISTEFSVLLSERHRQERLAGHDTVQALRRSYRHTGAAVAASGVTAIAGFGVLAFSDIRMLRDFGLVTLIDLSVSLIGVLLALPAAIVIAEDSESLRLRDGVKEALADAIATLSAGARRLGSAVRTRGRPGHAADAGGRPGPVGGAAFPDASRLPAGSGNEPA
ncbi:MAG: efflux RND transporter permease subunit [Solirubrobacteraceae bacterium]